MGDAKRRFIAKNLRRNIIIHIFAQYKTVLLTIKNDLPIEKSLLKRTLKN